MLNTFSRGGAQLSGQPSNGPRREIASLQTMIGIIEFGAAFKASNLASPFAASGQDVVDEPKVGADRC